MRRPNAGRSPDGVTAGPCASRARRSPARRRHRRRRSPTTSPVTSVARGRPPAPHLPRRGVTGRRDVQRRRGIPELAIDLGSAVVGGRSSGVARVDAGRPCSDRGKRSAPTADDGSPRPRGDPCRSRRRRSREHPVGRSSRRGRLGPTTVEVCPQRAHVLVTTTAGRQCQLHAGSTCACSLLTRADQLVDFSPAAASGRDSRRRSTDPTEPSGATGCQEPGASQPGNRRNAPTTRSDDMCMTDTPPPAPEDPEDRRLALMTALMKTSRQVAATRIDDGGMIAVGIERPVFTGPRSAVWDRCTARHRQGRSPWSRRARRGTSAPIHDSTTDPPDTSVASRCRAAPDGWWTRTAQFTGRGAAASGGAPGSRGRTTAERRSTRP